MCEADAAGTRESIGELSINTTSRIDNLPSREVLEAFFAVDINNNETRPEVLDVPITDIWKHRFFCVFFFCNSFLSEWNGVVINAIFGRMEVGCGGESLYDGDEATFPKFCGIGGKVRTEKLKLFSLFTAYERKYKCGGLMPRILFVRKIM